MQSRSILNIVLFIVVLVLTLNVYLVKNNKSTSTDVLTNAHPAKINRIIIEHNKRIINLEKNRNTWRMIKPINILADNFRVNTILKLLKTSTHGQYNIEGIDLNKYGLDQPITSINFNDIKIEFGITNPVSKYRYIKTNGKIYLIDDKFYPLISSQIGTLISRTLIQKNTEIRRIILPEHVLEIDDNGLWTSTNGISSDLIVETITNWKNDQAFSVHNYVKRKSLGSIEVHISNQDKPVKFEITDTDPWLVIARPELDIEYHFNAEFYNRLLKPGLVNPEDSPQETVNVPPEKFLAPLEQ